MASTKKSKTNLSTEFLQQVEEGYLALKKGQVADLSSRAVASRVNTFRSHTFPRTLGDVQAALRTLHADKRIGPVSDMTLDG